MTGKVSQANTKNLKRDDFKTKVGLNKGKSRKNQNEKTIKPKLQKKKQTKEFCL